MMVAFKDQGKQDAERALMRALVKCAGSLPMDGAELFDLVLVDQDFTFEDFLRAEGFVEPDWKCITEMDERELSVFDKQQETRADDLEG